MATSENIAGMSGPSFPVAGPTGIPEIDSRTKELQADDRKRKATAAKPKPLKPDTVVLKNTKRGAV